MLTKNERMRELFWRIFSHIRDQEMSNLLDVIEDCPICSKNKKGNCKEHQKAFKDLIDEQTDYKKFVEQTLKIVFPIKSDKKRNRK